MAFNLFSSLGNLISGGVNKAADYLAGTSTGQSVNKAVESTGGALAKATSNLGANISTAGGTGPFALNNQSSNTTKTISPTQTMGGPLYSPAQGEGATYKDAQNNTFRFDGRNWVQVSTGNVPASFQPSGGTPPVNQFPTTTKPPVAPPQSPSINYFNPTTTNVNSQGQLLTGFGGFGGTSAGQFGGGTGISGISGGGAALPGSLGSTFRSAGVFNAPTTEEEKKKKKQIIDITENRPTQSVTGFLGNQFGNAFNTLTGQFNAPPVFSTVAGATTPVANALTNVSQSLIGAGAEGAARLGQLGSNIGYGLTGLKPLQTLASGFGNTAEQWRQFGASGMMSEAQKATLAGIDTRKPIYNTPTGEAPSVKDLVSNVQSNIPKNVGTTSGTNKTISDRHEAIIGSLNELDAQVAGNTLEEQTLQNLANNSQQLFGQQLDSAGIRNLLNTDTTGAAMSAYNQTRQGIEKKIIDPVTGRIITQEDTDPSTYQNIYTEGDPKAQEILDFKTRLDDLKNTDPFAGQTVQAFTEDIYKDEGVVSAKKMRDAQQDLLNAKLGVYEGLAEEIKNDPDFSKKLKANRLSFLTDKQKTEVDILQRGIDSLNTKIKDSIESAQVRIKAAMDQYNVYTNERNFTQNQINTLNAQMEKASDNARATFNTIVSNPDLIKGASQIDLDREYASIQKNGYIPQTMIDRLKANTGKDVKTIVSGQTTSGTKTVYGLDSQGHAVYSFTMKDVSQAGADSRYSNVSYRDNGDGSVTTIGIDKSTNQPVILGTVEAGKTSPAYVQQQFGQWVKTNNGKFTEEQLRATVSTIPGLSQINLTDNKAMTDLISLYSSKGGMFDVGKVNVDKAAGDPIDSFTKFLGTTNTGSTGGQTRNYNVTASDGSTIKSLTTEQAQLLQSRGYTVVPQ